MQHGPAASSGSNPKAPVALPGDTSRTQRLTVLLCWAAVAVALSPIRGEIHRGGHLARVLCDRPHAFPPTLSRSTLDFPIFLCECAAK